MHRKETHRVSLSVGSVLANHYQRSSKESPEPSASGAGARG